MLVPWKKNYDEPRQHIQKQGHYFADKAHTVKVVIFLGVIYRCESWTIRRLKTEELMLLNCGAGEDS